MVRLILERLEAGEVSNEEVTALLERLLEQMEAKLNETEDAA